MLLPAASAREAAALGVVAALLWALPAALRSGAFVAGYAALAGTAAITLCALAILLVLARAETRAFGLVAAGLGLAAVPLAALGFALHAVTHHRGLGAATFGLVGMLAAVGATVVAARLPGLRRLALATACVAVLGLGAVAVIRGSVGLRWALADAALGVVLLVLALRHGRRAPPGLLRHGWLVAALSVGTATALLTASPDLARGLSGSAPVVFGLGRWVWGGS